CVCFLLLTFSSSMTCHTPSAASLFLIATATTAISSLSLHDALPISSSGSPSWRCSPLSSSCWWTGRRVPHCPGNDLSPALLCSKDRKSTRLNSSHVKISYAVFCLKKKKRYNSPPRFVEQRTTRCNAE